MDYSGTYYLGTVHKRLLVYKQCQKIDSCTLKNQE